MKLKKKIILVVVLFVMFTAISILIKVEAVSSNETKEHTYYTNFEGMVINEGSTADVNTGFIWAHNWQETRTVNRNNSTMLEVPVFDNDTYSTVGGFGIAMKSNLGKCTLGEAYDVQTYFEMKNIEYMFVEFVGGGDKWGSVIIYSDGFIRRNPGGKNISNVSYKDNILKFTFTMSFDSDANVNGYIKFTAYNSHDGVVYIDDVSIDHSDYVMNDSLEQMPLGLTTSHDQELHTNFYADNTVKTEFIKENNSTAFKASKITNSANATSLFFFTRLGVLNPNREYKMSFDLKAINAKKVFIYHAGNWVKNPSYITVDLVNNNAQTSGTAYSNAVYENGKLSVDFNMYNANYSSENWQMQILVQASDSSKESSIIMDNLFIEQLPCVYELELNTDDVKLRYTCGEELSTEGLKVYSILSNGDSEQVDLSKCEITGYNLNSFGKQKITVTYEGVSSDYIINVSRVVSKISANITDVKKTYEYGEDIDLSNLVATVSFVDDNGDVIIGHGPSLGGYAIDLGGFDKYVAGTYTITIYYLDVSMTFDVVVNEKTSISLGEYAFKATGK